MVRAGLGPQWDCLFANDIDACKAASYRANWDGGAELRLGDVAQVGAGDIPGVPDLVWGSFPCQDLSLAGSGAGLGGARSGTFHAFWSVVRGLIDDGRAPAIVAVENVCGTLTSRKGRDFETICRTFVEAGYRPGAMVIDARLFVPQSRPRLFVVGFREGQALPPGLVGDGPLPHIASAALAKAVASLPPDLRQALVWWRLPEPGRRNQSLDDLIEPDPQDVRWHDADETRRLLDMMSSVNLAKVRAVQDEARPRVGTLYRRTRRGACGERLQRAEVRFDRIAGCLRTPAGGSSRQTVLCVDGPSVRSRLMSGRETARLMGLPDSYRLPSANTEAYRLTGDGVVVPVVTWLARNLFEPLLAAR